jgi:hypothetical protein
MGWRGVLMPKILVRRGLDANIPVFDTGEPGFATDTKRVFIGSDEGNIELSKKSDADNLGIQLTGMKTELDKRGINPSSFGLDENADNNYQAIIDTFSFISVMQNGKGKIVFPQGKVFKFTQPLGTQTLSNITIDLNGSTLDFSAVPASNTDSALLFSGSIGSGTLLTANAAEGAKVIQCATTGLIPGDMVKVYSNKVWDSTRTSTRIGEICFIQSIDSATQLTLTTPLQDTYNVADSANIAKITPVENIVVKDGTLIGAAGNNEMRGLRITRGINCLIENVRTKGFDVNQIQLTDCVRCNVDTQFANEANHESMGYGVSFADASQDCIVAGSHYTDVRHSFTTNNNVSTSWGIVRRISFNNCIISDSSPALTGAGGDAIDTHAGSEDIFFNNLIVLSASGVGVNIEANRASINGLSVKGSGSVGIQFSPKADGRRSSLMVRGARLLNIGDGVGSDYGILCNLTVSDCDSIVISDSDIISQNTAIRLTSSNGYRFKKGSIKGNVCKALSGFAIELNNADFISVNGGSVEALNSAIGLTDSNNSSVSGVPVNLVGTSGTGYGVRLLGTSKRNVVNGNPIKHSGTLTTSYGVKVEDTATYNGIFGNVTENCTNNVTLGAGTGNLSANNI